MSTKLKIILAIAGGAAVGALGVCGIIWSAYAAVFATLSGLVATGVGLLTGIVITKES